MGGNTGRLYSTIKDDVDSSSAFEETTHDSKPAGSKPSTDPGTANNIQGESGTAKGGEGDKGTPAATDTKDTKPKTDDLPEGRFDQHPMFQRLNKDNRRLRDELLEMKGAITALLQAKGGKEGGEADPGFENIADMEPEAILESFNRDPKKFLANYGRQIAAETEEQLTGKSRTESFQDAQRKELETYASENADFIEMWESGEIPDYMKKHPGHTAISAHLRMTEPKRFEGQFKAKVDEAVKQAREEERRNAGVRSEASTVLPISRGTPKGDEAIDSILHDTSKAGGAINARMRWISAKLGRG
jgi:hypothetical protein